MEQRNDRRRGSRGPEGPRMNRYTVSEIRTSYRPGRIVDSSEQAASLFRGELDGLDRERFMVAWLNVKLELLGLEIVAVGSVSATAMHPREVLKPAIVHGASGILIAHNHPSGDPTPSLEDNRFTTRVSAACHIMGIALLDHIVIGRGGAFTSYRLTRPGLLGPKNPQKY